jgi:hypothetical protein
MHNLDEAMRIDTYLAGDDECLARRSTYTGALLFSMFDIGSSFIHSDKKNHPTMNGDIKSFEEKPKCSDKLRHNRKREYWKP